MSSQGNRARSASEAGFAPRPLVTAEFACRDFDLQGTLLSGQVFRWRESPPGSWVGWMGSRPVRISQRDGNLFFSGVSAEAVHRYFSLDLDLRAILRGIDVDPHIHAAIAAHRGLRLIRQEPWECLASFVLSAFNNIARLTGMLDRLAERYGAPVPRSGSDVFQVDGAPARPFPRAEALAAVPERALRACGLGYRAPYLRAVAQRVATGSADLEGWRRLGDEELREQLLALPGVGEKVVECVLLFAYGRAAAFPVDVWIGRVMRERYFRGRKVQDRKIREFALRHFGPHCGWAQQYLFCRVRRGSVSSGRCRPG